MNNTTYYQRNREVILNRAKDYYENNKERLRDKYRNLSEEDKNKKREHETIDIIICQKKRNKKTKRISKKISRGKNVSI